MTLTVTEWPCASVAASVGSATGDKGAAVALGETESAAGAGAVVGAARALMSSTVALRGDNSSPLGAAGDAVGRAVGRTVGKAVGKALPFDLAEAAAEGVSATR